MKRFLSVVVNFTVLALVVVLPGDLQVEAQQRVKSLVDDEAGHVALGLAIRRLGVSGTFMQAAAHPDDEHNGLYAMLTHGQGLRSIDVQTTRGGGGQNEIGPELFQDIAVLRTAELMAAHTLDGAEQRFTRAIDFGYSFSPEEIYRVWGRDEVVGDFTRLIRTFRPEVVLTMNIQGSGGDRAHEATAVLVREAYEAAADPARFPEQIREGLRPWQAKKLYFTGRRGGPPGAPTDQTFATIDTDIFDPLLGRTYSEIGFDARSNHKCQGMGQLSRLPGAGFGRRGGYQLVETTIPGQKGKDEASLFEGIDTGLTSLAEFAGQTPPDALTSGLAAIADAARRAREAFDARDDDATAAPIEAGLTAVRALRARLNSMDLDENARYEIDFRLQNEEEDFENAVLAAHGLSLQAVADDGLVVGGQPINVTLLAVNRGASDVTLSEVAVAGFDATGGCQPAVVAKRTGIYTCDADVRVPATAKLTDRYWTDRYWKSPRPALALNIYDPDVPWGAPFRPTPFRATFRVKAGDVEVTRDLPVRFRYADDIFVGEKEMDVSVVPTFSVKTTPTMAVIPAAAAESTVQPVEEQVMVSVTNGTSEAAQATVRLELPEGWTAEPATAPLEFMSQDEALTVRFTVTVPATASLGEHLVRAVVTSPATGSQQFASGYQEVEYPHIERRQVIKPAETTFKVMDVRITPDITLGYIVGAGDQVPPALEQLGASVTFIDTDELAWGELSRYDVIMTGVRAYERRTDLQAYNRRLIDYVEDGGTLIVQYNKMAFNQEQYGPYPATVSRNRVTDETGPVRVLVSDHPVFNTPNTIDEDTWRGWVQERGLYFLGEKDPQYVDLLSVEEPFPDNAGVKVGALVEAKAGEGRWIYVGLGLWRQIPAGVEGAYELLANLISLGRAPQQAAP